MRACEEYNSIEGISIVIPAYNEEQGLPLVLDELQEVMRQIETKWEIIVVDDGSTDCTAQIARERKVRVISHVVNRGYGAALKTGIRHALYSVVVITDADGTYPVAEILHLVEPLADCDMVVGARVGSKVQIPLARQPAKWFLNRLAGLLADMEIPDLNSGLRAMRKRAVLDFFNMLPNGFSFTTTLTLALLVNNYRVKYQPINYNARVGRSKIRPLRDTMNFIILIMRTVLFFAPLKVLAPLGGGLFLIGGGKLIYDLLANRPQGAPSTILILMAALQITVLAFLADLIVAQRNGGKYER